MDKKWKLSVLMAGKYDIVKGARIGFHLDAETGLYIASCGRKDFGIVKSINGGSREDLRMLGTDFGGIVVRTDPDQYLAEAVVKMYKKDSAKRMVCAEPMFIGRKKECTGTKKQENAAGNF